MALHFLDMKFEHVQLCSYPGLPLCIGCCGHDFTTQEEICRDIRLNNVALDNTENLHSFRNRHGKDVRQSGICPCVVRKDGVAQCAIHPLILKTQDDMRDGFCNIMFECKTAWEFKSWSQ